MSEVKIELPPLHPGQHEIFHDEARFKVVCCGRRWGKTHLGVLMCIVYALRGKRAWWIAPTYSVASIGWNLLRAMCKAIPGIEMKEVEKKIFFPSGGWIQVKTGDRPDLLRGESLDLVVFDEVADIREECWTEAVRPALADRKGHALFIGTPRGQDNWFYDVFMKATNGSLGWKCWQQPTTSNPFIPPEEVEAAREDMHPLLFAQEFLAEFIVAGGQVFQPEWERWYQLIGEQHEYDERSSLVLMHQYAPNTPPQIHETMQLSSTMRFLTCDLAASLKTTADYTVIAAWARTPKRRLCLLDMKRARMEGPEMIPAMRAMRMKWKAAYVGIERVGFQLTMVQAARRAGLPVQELKADKDKVSRAYLAAAHMQGERLWFRRNCPEMGEMLSELRAFPNGRHDDTVDTLSYAAVALETVAARGRRQLGSF